MRQEAESKRTGTYPQRVPHLRAGIHVAAKEAPSDNNTVTGGE